MRVSLVTGGAGFIGSHLVRALLERGDHVRVLDNFSTGRVENLPDGVKQLEILEGDIREPARVAGAVRGVRNVFHLAAMVSPALSMEDPLTCMAINDMGTLNLFEATRQQGVECVVLVSSCAVYGDSELLPLSEESPTMPISPYAASKLVAEIHAKMYSRVFDLPVVTLRYFNVYGPRQRPDSPYAAVIPIFIHQMLQGKAPTVFGNGMQQRDFIYVGDVVRANLLAAEKVEAAGEVFNVCTGKAVDLLDLISILGEFIPVVPQPVFEVPRPGDIFRSLGDPSRAAHVLNFRAEISLRDGLAQTLEWMRS
ncbi:MAG: SDR family oxidoreductase [Chloroflexota bacterium]